MLKKKAEFVIIDAPNVIPTGEQNPENNQACVCLYLCFRSICLLYANILLNLSIFAVRGWWFSDANDQQPAFYSMKSSTKAIGYDESLNDIMNAFKTQGPFDGILGFSQGGAMTALVCGLIEQNSRFV